MTDDTTPQRAVDVVRSHLDRFEGGINGALADSYSVDAVVEQPFMPGTPHRLEGRDAIRAHFTAAASMPLELRVRNLIVHQMLDPELVVAEYDYDGRVTTTGERFTAGNIQVFRIRNGLIAASRDYHDHSRLSAALHH